MGHSVSIQNSGATRHISPVRRHTTVGVPLKDISFSSSCRNERQSTLSAKSPDTHQERPLEAFLNKNLIIQRQGHLKCDE
jgi:hypothetical protein